MADDTQNEDEQLRQLLLSHTPAEVLGMLMLDIRRPTYSIQGCADILLSEEVSPEAKTHILQLSKVTARSSYA